MFSNMENILAVKVPASCNDNLQDSSMRYAERVAKQIQCGTSPKAVKIAMEMQIMRELSAK